MDGFSRIRAKNGAMAGPTPDPNNRCLFALLCQPRLQPDEAYTFV